MDLQPDAELIAFWRNALEAIDPLRPLAPDEIASLYQERPDTPSTEIAVRLLRAGNPADHKVLLYGARGAGKSTELSCLAQRLHAHFAVVQVDLGAGLPDRANTLAVITLLGAAALRAVRDWRHPDADALAMRHERYEATLRSFEDSLQKLGLAAELVGRLVEAVDPVLSAVLPDTAGAARGVGAAVAAGGSVVARASTLRRELSRGPLGERLSPDRLDDARAVVAAVNGVLAELSQLAGRPALLLADGFDKRTDLDDVRLALSDAGLLAELAAPVVLTGPVVLRHEPQFRGMERGFSLASLPNVAVRRRSGDGVEDSPDGVALLVDLFEKRVRRARLPADLVAPEALRLAAVMSSGIVREFLELLVWSGDLALGAGARRIEVAQVQAAVRRRRLALQGYLDERSVSILQRVLRKPAVLPADDEADVLLFENLLACYANGDLWYRPHEAIAESVAGTMDDG